MRFATSELELNNWSFAYPDFSLPAPLESSIKLAKGPGPVRALRYFTVISDIYLYDAIFFPLAHFVAV